MDPFQGRLFRSFADDLDARNVWKRGDFPDRLVAYADLKIRIIDCRNKSPNGDFARRHRHATDLDVLQDAGRSRLGAEPRYGYWCEKPAKGVKYSAPKSSSFS